MIDAATSLRVSERAKSIANPSAPNDPGKDNTGQSQAQSGAKRGARKRVRSNVRTARADKKSHVLLSLSPVGPAKGGMSKRAVMCDPAPPGARSSKISRMATKYTDRDVRIIRLLKRHKVPTTEISAAMVIPQSSASSLNKYGLNPPRPSRKRPNATT